MRVMGVDPGLTRCGLSMIEGGTGRKVTALDVDVVRTPSDVELQRRLLTVKHILASQRRNLETAQTLVGGEQKPAAHPRRCMA